MSQIIQEDHIDIEIQDPPPDAAIPEDMNQVQEEPEEKNDVQLYWEKCNADCRIMGLLINTSNQLF